MHYAMREVDECYPAAVPSLTPLQTSPNSRRSTPAAFRIPSTQLPTLESVSITQYADCAITTWAMIDSMSPKSPP